MTAMPGSKAIPTSGLAPALGVAVVELLGPEEARMRVSDLAAEAAAGGISVRIVSRRAGTDSVPQRRRRAVDGADAPVVCLIEDTTCLAPGWATALRDAFADARVAAACGPVRIATDLPPRYRALGRLEYGRFDGTDPAHHLPGNAFALRRADLGQVLAPDEGIIEHDVERRLVLQGRQIRGATGLTAIYARPDQYGARLSTRFGHGRIYGADRHGNRVQGVFKAMLAMPVLSLRAFRAARAAGTARQWLPEVPWIVAMSTAWALGELTGQIAGKGKSAGSWN